ncbi:hypothetical protein LWI29_017068 [Acer saccharum]|uniref:Uncharacterized protein n=1 Tax=Acer saccharum TaxID=4024 RepID=A0AA39W9E9_ACESA|nr:hypothetical protein LWI29_017068 [Acer saccharum]
MILRYVVSSDEEGAGEPALAETPSIQTDVHEDPGEGTNAAVPPPEEVNELNIPAATPPRTASPPVATGESNVSSDQASILAAEKFSDEESHAQQLAQLRESSDGHLSAQLAVEEKLSVAEEEIHSLKEHLSASQESFAAHLEAERVAEKAREKAKHEVLDLRNQLSSRELIFDNLKAVLEVEAVDRFKRSLAYDVLLLREFERGMRQSKKFFAMKDHSNEKALRRFDRTEPHPMHLEIPSKRAFNTYYSGQNGSFSGFGAEPDLGPVAGRDYEPFMPDGDEEVTWPSEEEIEDEEDNEGPPAAS